MASYETGSQLMILQPSNRMMRRKDTLTNSYEGVVLGGKYCHNHDTHDTQNSHSGTDAHADIRLRN